MSTVQIDKDIPLPTFGVGLGNKGRPEKWPWAQMEVGDSFLESNSTQQKMSTNCWNAGRRLKAKFRTSKVDGGVRVWRVA